MEVLIRQVNVNSVTCDAGRVIQLLHPQSQMQFRFSMNTLLSPVKVCYDFVVASLILDFVMSCSKVYFCCYL